VKKLLIIMVALVLNCVPAAAIPEDDPRVSDDASDTFESMEKANETIEENLKKINEVTKELEDLLRKQKEHEIQRKKDAKETLDLWYQIGMRYLITNNKIEVKLLNKKVYFSNDGKHFFLCSDVPHPNDLVNIEEYHDGKKNISGKFSKSVSQKEVDYLNGQIRTLYDLAIKSAFVSLKIKSEKVLTKGQKEFCPQVINCKGKIVARGGCKK